MRRYFGTGVLTFPKIGNFDGSFSLVFDDSGKAVLELELRKIDKAFTDFINKKDHPVGSFEGTMTQPSGTLKVNEIHFGRCIQTGATYKLSFDLFHPIFTEFGSLNSNDEIEVRYGLTNFLFYGIEITQRGNEYRKDTIKLVVEDQEVRLVQCENFKEIEDHLKKEKDVRVTSELVIISKFDKFKDIEKMTENLQSLCSLASGNYVTSLYEDVFKHGQLMRSTLFPLKTYPYSPRRGPIDISLFGAKELKNFLESSYPNFINYKSNLGLNIVIEYAVTSRIFQPLELAYLLGATTLECLESYLPKFLNKPKIKDWCFRNKTKKLCDTFGIKYSTSDLEFIKLRNNVVHTGRFPKNVDAVKSYYKLINFVDRILLTILGYKGQLYVNFVSKIKEQLP